MRLRDACNIVSESQGNRIKVLRRVLNDMIMSDTDCETCPYVVTGEGCPDRIFYNARTGKVNRFSCVDAYEKFYEKNNKAEAVATPLTKSWQQLVLWRIIDTIIYSGEFDCKDCPAFLDCPVEIGEMVSRENCHRYLWRWGTNEIEEERRLGQAERLLEQFISTEESGAGDTTSSRRE